MIESYRSYVIRVRRHADDDAVRLDVEDLLGGGRVAVTGDEARVLAEHLGAMIANGVNPRPVRPSGTVGTDESPAAPPAAEQEPFVRPSGSGPRIRTPASSP
jgi:hypothetical protein